MGHFVPQAVTDVSPHRPEFNPRPFCLGFMVDRIALGQNFLQGILLFSVSIILSLLHTHALFIHHDAMLAEQLTASLNKAFLSLSVCLYTLFNLKLYMI